MMKIVGISGYAGSGKDELAKTLVSEFDFRQISFAGPLYKEVSDAFNIPMSVLSDRPTKESPKAELALVNCADKDFVRIVLGDNPSKDELDAPRSPRFIMQKWGTEYKRSIDDNYWINKLVDVIKSNAVDEDYVITDVRFDNEAKVLMRLGGVIVWVDRDVERVISHASEGGLSKDLIDEVIKNDGTIEDLKRKARGLYFQYESLMSETSIEAELTQSRNVRL